MIEARLFPVRLVVAGLALFAFLALVFVILHVARVAVGLRFLPVEKSAVAAGAPHLRVFTTQWVMGIACVIEFNDLPVFFHVTALT